MTKSGDALPLRVQALVGAVALLGLACCSVAWSAVARAPLSAESLAWGAAVAVIVLVGDIVLLEIRLGRNGNGFTWAEAALIVGVAIGGWAWLIAVMGPVVLLRQLAAGRRPHKAVFNAGSAVVSAALGWAAYGLVSSDWDGLGTPMTWRAALALALAAGVYFLAVTVQITTAVAWAQGLPTRAVWARGWHLRVVMFLGNTMVGLAAVLVGQWNRPTILVLPFFFLLLYLCYNSALKAQQDRDLWQQLHAATLRLNRVELPAVLAGLEHGATALFGVERTVVLHEDDLGLEGQASPALLARGCGLSAPQTVDVRTESAPVAEEMRRLGVVTAALAPLVVAGRTRGALLLGYRGHVRLNRRELQMIGTFADQASMSLQHVALFDEIDAQRRRLSVILDNASDGILLLDADGIVLSWNPAMAQLTGRSEAEAVGAPLEAVLPGALENGEPLSAARLFAPSPSEVDGRVVRSDGAERDVSLAVATVDAADDAYAVVVARDITAQREVQIAKEDFIATVSHELRTPLTPIKGYLRLLQRPGFGDDATRREEAVGVLVEQSSQLERLVEDLLSVSRMRHGQFDVEPEVGDVDSIVARAVRDAGLSSSRQVVHTRTPSPAPARCDPARLQQVVANLLSNADKYSPAEEPVLVEVRDTCEGVEITVTDRGSGVPVESREAVFEPFQRLGHHLTRRTRGTGLGLHIAQRLVTAMDGRIWVDGPPGGGATFHVRLPRAESAAPAWDDTALARTS